MGRQEGNARFGVGGDQAAMTRAERLRIIAEVHQIWEASHEEDVSPDPEYAGNEPSQYPEGIVSVSCDPHMDEDLVNMLRGYGVAPVPARTSPTKYGTN